MEGWVSFHRKIEEWEWYDDANTFRLFFHLVLKANHKDNKWRGIDIKRGEIVTSNEQLAKQLKLTISKIRTSLEKLKSTGEITIKTTNKNTVVTIANYDLYQSVDGRIANKTTDKSQSNRNQIATNNNDKNENNEKKEDNLYFAEEELNKTFLEFIEFRKQIKKPMSELSITKLINKLNLMTDSVTDKIKILDNSIINNWQGIFPLKETQNQPIKQNGPNVPKSTSTATREKEFWED